MMPGLTSAAGPAYRPHSVQAPSCPHTRVLTRKVLTTSHRIPVCSTPTWSRRHRETTCQQVPSTQHGPAAQRVRGQACWELSRHQRPLHREGGGRGGMKRLPAAVVMCHVRWLRWLPRSSAGCGSRPGDSHHTKATGQLGVVQGAVALRRGTCQCGRSAPLTSFRRHVAQPVHNMASNPAVCQSFGRLEWSHVGPAGVRLPPPLPVGPVWWSQARRPRA